MAGSAGNRWLAPLRRLFARPARQLPFPRDNGFWIVENGQARFQPFRQPPDVEPQARLEFSSLPQITAFRGGKA